MCNKPRPQTVVYEQKNTNKSTECIFDQLKNCILFSNAHIDIENNIFTGNQEYYSFFESRLLVETPTICSDNSKLPLIKTAN